MCGIAGYWLKNGNATSHLTNLENAIKRLNKRGPDYSNFFSQKNVGLGHARLSIIDTSAAANQPFSDETGNFTIIFNGEIYNFMEHRKLLEKDGVKFRTNSDTEVLLELYKKHHTETPSMLNGFFAFAIYNHTANELFLARDRFGIKPLYLAEDETQICFASEIKALIELNIDKTPDFNSIQRYFQLNYIPGPDTIFKNVKQIEPGTSVLINNKGKKLLNYYTPPQKPDYTGGYKEAQQKLKALMLKSVEKRLIADVPLGSFLSGGIDSSIIATLTAKINPNIESFSIGFPDEPYFDETQYAKAVATKAGLKHHIIDVHSKDMLEALPDVLDYIDQPFADSSAIPVFILSREIRKHVTVALSGDGADELFGGYRKHMAHKRALNPSIFNTIIKNAAPFFEAAPQSRQNKIADKARQVARFSRGIKLKGAARYWFWASISSESYTNELLINKPETTKLKPWEQLGLHIPTNHGLHHILNADIKMLLPGDMLTKVDMMSMANSLEVRVPFLDHELVDFTMQLPNNYKINKNQQKRILQDTFRDELPESLYNRPKKGFEIPLVNWFRNELNDFIFHEILNEEKIKNQQILNHKTIAKLRSQLMSASPGDAPARIWALIVFQNWWDKNMN